MFSFRNRLNNVYTIRMRMTVNGNAEMREAVCNPSRPLAMSRTAAMPPSNTPQTMRTARGGFKLPFVVILLMIYVAESADVIKNVRINIIDKIDKRKLNGNSANVTNKALVTSASTA